MDEYEHHYSYHYSGAKRSNEEWLRDLQQEGSLAQQLAYQDLGAFLRIELYRYILSRRSHLPLLAELDTEDLEWLADDFVQQALISLHEGKESFEDRGSFLGFAKVIGLNEARNEFRRKRWHIANTPLAVNPDSSDVPWNPTYSELPDLKNLPPDVDVVLKEVLEIVYETVKNDLTENQSVAFVAFYLNDVPTSDIAIYFGKSNNAVSLLLDQGRKKIRGRLLGKGYDNQVLELFDKE